MTQTPVPAASSSTDGRRRRSEASRDRIVTAIMGLVAGGAITPSAEDIAARAEVGLRSVFRHFKDMDSLYAQMWMQIAANYAPALQPYTAADWRGRLHESIDRRVEIFERLLPFKRASDAHRHESAMLQARHEDITALLRQRLHLLLPPHLQSDVVAFESLDLLLSIDTWCRLRFDQKLAPETARAVVEGQAERLVAA